MQITKEIASTYGISLNEAEIEWQKAVNLAGRNLSALAAATEAGQVSVNVSVELFSMAKAGIDHLIGTGEAYAKLHDKVSAIARLSGLEPSSFGFSGGPTAATTTAPLPLRVVDSAIAA